MRIGIVPGLNFADGGIYQYSVTVLQALDKAHCAASLDQFIIFANDLQNANLRGLTRQDWILKPLLPPVLTRRSLKLVERVVGPRPRAAALRLIRRRPDKRRGPQQDPDHLHFNHEIHQWFRTNGIELMLYPTSTALSFEAGIPYVMAVHDLQHRLQPEFPEVSADGEWESREYLFRNGIRHATIVLAESQTGKEDILNFYGGYGVTEDRIKILPLLPASILPAAISGSEKQGIRRKYELPERYLFYPAQFWPHKNHARIIEALGLLRARDALRIPVAFCGSHEGAIREEVFKHVNAIASRMDLSDDIYYLGYVPDRDIASLYAGAVALVMPTFFGPSNIPILEAWKLNCPVLTSNIRGVCEQAGEAAVLVDPRSVEAIAEGIKRLWLDEGLRQALIDRGRQRLDEFTPEDFRLRLMQILAEAKVRATRN